MDEEEQKESLLKISMLMDIIEEKIPEFFQTSNFITECDEFIKLFDDVDGLKDWNN